MDNVLKKSEIGCAIKILTDTDVFSSDSKRPLMASKIFVVTSHPVPIILVHILSLKVMFYIVFHDDIIVFSSYFKI